MKSIKQQYIDLKEGRMSQANFMRNLRMTMPQYITNVTSLNDSVKILRNKGILSEADLSISKDTVDKMKSVLQGLTANNNEYHRDGYTMGFFEGKGEEEEGEEMEDEESLKEAKQQKGSSGKEQYANFKEIDNLNSHEVLIGIDYEIEKDHELTKEEAIKIVLKNLKKDPFYYTASLMAGTEGFKSEYIGGKSANPEARQMQPVKDEASFVDKKMGMQPVKGIEKPKKDADAKKETIKPEKGVSLMSLVAKTTRGVKKMDATGEKMKKVAMKEARLNDFPGETPGTIAQQIATYVDSNPTLKKYSDEITLQSNPDGFLRFRYWDPLPSDAARALELQFNIQVDSDFDEDTGELIFYRLTPKHSVAKIDLGKYDLMKLREVIREIAGAYGGDAMDAEDGSSYTND